jgi:putative transcriptional regulator
MRREPKENAEGGGGHVSLAGSLLLAKPGMPDPNFRRTVVLMSVHSNEGAIGLVINRPTGETIGSLRPEFAGGPLEAVPVFNGGPVHVDRLILAAWQLMPAHGTFKLFFGLEPARVLELKNVHANLEVRAYRGYSGWAEGQLESELERGDWLVEPVNSAALEEFSGVELWRELVGRRGPYMKLQIDVPDDPGLN